jgi:hypothetical protein
MFLRWLPAGLVPIALSMFGCTNQGRGVGPDVIDQLCELNREAVERLHTPYGVSQEDTFQYCDYWVDHDGDGIADGPEVQSSCKPMTQGDMDMTMNDCVRIGIRAQNRCWEQMQAMLTCMTSQLEKSSDRQDFFNEYFSCWTDVNGNGRYDGGLYWSLPADASSSETDLNHTESCASTCKADGTCSNCGQKDDGAASCHLLQDLPRHGDETIKYGGVALVTKKIDDAVAGSVLESNVCEHEYVALNLCAKESGSYLGTAGATGVGSP